MNNICCVYSLELPHRSSCLSDDCSHHTGEEGAGCFIVLWFVTLSDIFFYLLILQQPLTGIMCMSFRKNAYSNIILPSKNKNSQMKHSGSFHISAQNIDYGCLLGPPWRGGSNEYPQSMFLSRKLMYTPVNSSFTV